MYKINKQFEGAEVLGSEEDLCVGERRRDEGRGGLMCFSLCPRTTPRETRKGEYGTLFCIATSSVESHA